MPYEEERGTARPAAIFLSYAREDWPLVSGLRAHLSGLERDGSIRVLNDSAVRAGESWNDPLGEILLAADIALLCFSPAFLLSPYCASDVRRVVQLQGERGLSVIPVLLRACDRTTDNFFVRLSELRALPSDDRPVTSWENQDEAFADVAQGIVRAVEGLRGESARAGRGAGARAVEFTVEEGDVTDFKADAVVLKYAQAFYGADEAVMNALKRAGVGEGGICPKEGEHVYVETRGAIRAPHALFVGTPALFEFDYDDIRTFSARALEALAREAPSAEHAAMTIHGVGYGLDETEAAYEQFAGLWDALSAGKSPPALRRISVVDVQPARIERLRRLYASAFDAAPYASRVGGETWAYRLDPASEGDLRGRGGIEMSLARDLKVGGPLRLGRGPRAAKTPYVFVAMPFKEEMEDVFYYGMQNSAHAIDYLCERIDQESFTGDILERVKAKIEGAAVVIADLTGDNPNVFLEVGYAWGKGRPTLLVVRESKRQQLRFDVQGQRCIKYTTIHNLERDLTKILKDLKADGSI